MPKTIAIAGGGASGVVLAAHILDRMPDARVVIHEPHALGRGLAYATSCPLHLLNVPAARMSALAADPGHFVRWLAGHAPAYDATAFAPRMLYGDYLADIARDLIAAGRRRFAHVRAEMCTLEDAGDADAIVVATGNAAPAAWPGAPHDPRFFRSAWAPGALEADASAAPVLLLGSGLTAIDAALALRANGHAGAIVMLSRRGLTPHDHRILDAPPSDVPDAADLRAMLRRMRSLARDDWRGVVDRARPNTNAFWQSLDHAERQRFLRHVLPYWNVHRHRMAPEIARAIAERLAVGDLSLLAARTTGIDVRPDGLHVRIRERGAREERTLIVGRAINCSGPQHDYAKLANPLIASLIAGGAMVRTPIGVGVDVAADGALVDARGAASSRLFTIGPVRYGTLIETTAIPEIREQAAELADRLAR